MLNSNCNQVDLTLNLLMKTIYCLLYTGWDSRGRIMRSFSKKLWLGAYYVVKKSLGFTAFLLTNFVKNFPGEGAPVLHKPSPISASLRQTKKRGKSRTKFECVSPNGKALKPIWFFSPSQYQIVLSDNDYLGNLENFITFW